jgi:hypothetical protein
MAQTLEKTPKSGSSVVTQVIDIEKVNAFPLSVGIGMCRYAVDTGPHAESWLGGLAGHPY